MDPEQRPGPVVRPASGAAVHLAVAGDQQAFVATPGEAHAEQVEGGNEALHGLVRDGLQDKSEQAAGPREVTLPQRVVTAGRQRRVEHFGNFPGVVKVVLAGSMVLGRLEIFTVLVFLSPEFWRR